MPDNDENLTLRGLIGEWKQEEREWKAAMLTQLRTLNGTVATHTTSIALLAQADQNQNAHLLEACSKLDAGLERVRAVELSQVKAGVICGLIGAGFAALPALIVALRAVVK